MWPDVTAPGCFLAAMRFCTQFHWWCAALPSSRRPIPWLYMPEILPVEILGVAQVRPRWQGWGGCAALPWLRAVLGWFKMC